MQFSSRYQIGQRVRIVGGGRRRNRTFTIGEIRIQTLRGGACLVEYRAIYSTGRPSQWIAERFLREIEDTRDVYLGEMDAAPN